MKQMTLCGASGMSSAECAPALSAYISLLSGKKLTLETTDVSCPFDDGNLETETNTQVWDFLFSGPFGRRDHSLGTSQSETTGNDDTPGVSFQLLYMADCLTWRNIEPSRRCDIGLGLASTFPFLDPTSLPTISSDLPFTIRQEMEKKREVSARWARCERLGGMFAFGLITLGRGE